jgi:beta-mannosidase
MTKTRPETKASRRRIDPAWRVARLQGHASQAAERELQWMPAAVPGAVQLDWAREKGLPDINHGQNVRLYDGLEDSAWIYETQVPGWPREAGRGLFFVCHGVDFACEVRLDGAAVLTHSGMVAPLEVEVTGAEPGARLQVLIFPAPKRHPSPEDRSQASHVTKPAVSYGWDWHPRIIPLGISGEAYFEERPRAHLRRVDFDYTLSEDLASADVTVAVDASVPGAVHSWRLLDPEGACVLEGGGPARLERPRLWWTHDHGAQPLYTLEVALEGGDSLARRVGFRRVRLLMHEGAWDAELPMPKSRNPPPTSFELNGRRIFIKGSNWVNPDLFHGRVGYATYRPLVALARGANLNLLRCWGGAPAEKEAFYDLCDREGVLVWQEFPLACNLYPDDRAYLELLDRESRALIQRVRQHPCLAIWVGGNELFNAWSRMTDQSLALRLLNRNCFDLDPLTPFMPTVPLEGMGHGDYRFRNAGRDVFQTFQQASCTAYSEFGCPGPSPVPYLRAIIPEHELWPPRPGTSWETHHGLNAWEADETTWLCTSIIEAYFGPQDTLDGLVRLGNWLQCEGLKSVFEEARRQQPRCSMALNWCFNEPWPTAANESIINWPAEPKPAYASVALACRPVMASARIPRFQWLAGEEFGAEVWLLNDTAEEQPGGAVSVELASGGRRWSLGSWEFPRLRPLGALAGPRFSARIPEDASGEMILLLTASPNASWSSTYRLSLRSPTLPPPT